MAFNPQITQRTFDYLYGSFPTESPFISKVTAGYNSSVDSITVLDDNQWEVNDIVENQDTGEQMLVLAKPGANVLTVSRGWGDTTASAGAADDLVAKNPRFTIKKVENALTSTLPMIELWGVHSFGHGTVTRADPKQFYELSETDLIPQLGVLKVYAVADNSEVPYALPFRYQFHLGTGPTEYGVTGTGIHIGDWGQVKNGESAHFIYAKRIVDTDVITVRQEELVILGAVVILLGGTIIPATHDPGRRTDRTVQPGQTSRDVRHFQGRFITEVRMEVAELAVQRQKLLHEPVQLARSRRWIP